MESYKDDEEMGASLYEKRLKELRLFSLERRQLTGNRSETEILWFTA